jgi:hypothetical protein
MRTLALALATVLATGTLVGGCSTTTTSCPVAKSPPVLRFEPRAVSASAPSPVPAHWDLNATLIEACSCPMFCPCYFSTDPEAFSGCPLPQGRAEGAPSHCRFARVLRVNRGAYGAVRLDGARLWLVGANADAQPCVVHFDPALTPEQREGLLHALGALFPGQGRACELGADLPIEWSVTHDESVARLDGARGGEIVLHKLEGMTDDPVVIRNLKYWGAPRNDGFVLMPGGVLAYRRGARPFELRSTSGFQITVDLNSLDDLPGMGN